MVDTGVADHLLRAVRAAALLGAEVVLGGIAPTIAQTIVQLGVDLSGVTTRGDLQAGIAHALRRRGLEIRPLEAAAARRGPARRRHQGREPCDELLGRHDPSSRGRTPGGALQAQGRFRPEQPRRRSAGTGGRTGTRAASVPHRRPSRRCAGAAPRVDGIP